MTNKLLIAIVSFFSLIPTNKAGMDYFWGNPNDSRQITHGALTIDQRNGQTKGVTLSVSPFDTVPNIRRDIIHLSAYYGVPISLKPQVGTQENMAAANQKIKEVMSMSKL